MGLHVTSLAEFTNRSDGIRDISYFVYFLNYYQFSDDIVDKFIAEIPTLERHFSELGNALLITSLRNVDFYSEVLSWHNVVGVDPENFGPSFLICTVPPSAFVEGKVDASFDSADTSEIPWIILPLQKFCDNAKDLNQLLKVVVGAMSQNKPLAGFEPDEIFRYMNRPIVSGKPKYLGMEFDLQSLWRTIKKIKLVSKPQLPAIYSDEDDD
ncbi:hypothetical protein A9Q96_16230 [Rhodobacterales bacterium 52_120_T64]|nr:hypothetical protein A9Q96_16230 [Rhodobacterales bacterium 52_120_T64]